MKEHDFATGLFSVDVIVNRLVFTLKLKRVLHRFSTLLRPTRKGYFKYIGSWKASASFFKNIFYDKASDSALF